MPDRQRDERFRHDEALRVGWWHHRGLGNGRMLD
jgi:hypothetical protein